MLPVQSTQQKAVSANGYKARSTEKADFSGVMQGAAKTQSLDNIFEKAAAQYDVPVSLLKAIAKAESNFNPKAVSHAGAKGVMQLMPATAKALGVTDAFDPEQNIMGGAKYISQMLKRYDGNTKLALAAYNAGSGNVKKYGGIPPFKETQNYVKKVMRYAGENISAGDYTPSVSKQNQKAPVPKTAKQDDIEQSIISFMDFTEMDYLLFIEALKQRTSLSLSDILNDVTEERASTADIFGAVFRTNAVSEMSLGLSADTTNLMGDRFQKMYE